MIHSRSPASVSSLCLPTTATSDGGDMRASDTPVWIIGGGKTAMDTAHALITEYPGREVNLVAGRGTFFGSRDTFFPTGATAMVGRHACGSSSAVSGPAIRRDQRGRRCGLAPRHIRQRVDPEAENFSLGVLSESENKTISAGLNDVMMDHFVDAVDRNGATELVFRSGATKSIEPGSWIVNCTGYLVRGTATTPTSPTFPDSGAGGLYSACGRATLPFERRSCGLLHDASADLEKLRELPLYELDGQDLRKKSRTVVFPYMLFDARPTQPQPDLRTASRPRCSLRADSTSIPGIHCRVV